MALVCLMAALTPRTAWAEHRTAEDGLMAESVKAALAGTPALLAPEPVRAFYARRGHKPVWVHGGRLKPELLGLLDALDHAADHGLDPEFFRRAELSTMQSEILYSQWMGQLPTKATLAGFDLLATDAFIAYGRALLNGFTEAPSRVSVIGDVDRHVDLGAYLEEAVAADAVSEGLEALAPQHEGYQRLKAALVRYRAIEGSAQTQPIPAGLEPGARSDAVKALRALLVALGDMDAPDTGAPELYTDALARGVERFQRRHGLPTSGRTDQATAKELNTPVRKRIAAIAANMERWRWFPNVLPEAYISVNMTDFTLSATVEGQPPLRMKVIIGKGYQSTPLMVARMTYMAFNPSWNVPTSIAVDEIAPHAARDPEYLTAHGMQVIEGWGPTEVVVSPSEIEWADVTRENFNLRIVQVPGGSNPLGRVKFLFPNPSNVYLHDTTANQLFDQKVRTFSHGCIRIEKPLELALLLLNRGKKDGPWTMERVEEILAEGKEVEVNLPTPIDVLLTYQTAMADEDGGVRFNPDIYRQDRKLIQDLLAY
jgi:murein L,D-transpeptidase YcbB/YkuD